MPVLYHNDGFPPPTLNWSELIPFIGKANAAIAKYEGLLEVIPNPNILLSPLASQEAVLSSRIEGTQATLGEVLEFEAKAKPQDETSEKNIDIQEVLNYRTALSNANELLLTLPLSQRLIKQTHSVLLDGVRGRSKSPGEYRKIPNWIGSAGSTIETARFVPCGAEKLEQAMSLWENFIHSDYSDPLVQLALIHAEFEAIHPFLDGNGRLGRLLIPLFLKSKGLLSQPNFYMSAYLETNRDEYYERLLAVSSQQAWTEWCLFFLKGLIFQAHENQNKAKKIIEFYAQAKELMVKETRSQFAITALDFFFKKPIFTSLQFIEATEIQKATARRIMEICLKNKLLRQIRPGRGRAPAVLIMPELLNIVEGRLVF